MSAGLFRATGKRRRARPVMLDGSIIRSDQRPRAEDDFEPTPPEPTLALFAYEEGHIDRYGGVWEPACGDGRMARDLESCGLAVIRSDKVDRGCGAIVKDFFFYQHPLAPAIVTNPPFNACNWTHGRGRWIEHALGTLGVEYMALLLPLQWMCVAQLGPLRRRYRPSVIYAINWRIDFSGEGQQPANHAWYVWDSRRGGTGVTALVDMFQADPRQARLGLAR